MNREAMTANVRALRQSAIVATSAANAACRAAGKSNPSRMLRLWTAELTTKRLMAPAIKYVKGSR